MSALDWSQCPDVESSPEKVSGAWVFRGTRMPVATVFENLETGATIENIMESFDLSREQIATVLEFAARSLPAPDPVKCLFFLTRDPRALAVVPAGSHR